MTNITWGPEIAVDGVKPAWLADDDVCAVLTDGAWYGLEQGSTFAARYWTWVSAVTAIRLLANHWAYPIIEKGFWPWAGGDKAPDDWDGGEVLLREGYLCPGGQITHWNHDDSVSVDAQIIGYRRRTDAPVETSELATLSDALGLAVGATREERLDAIRALCADDLQAYVAPIGTRVTVLHHGGAQGGLIVGASLGLVYGEGDTPRTIFGERVDDTVTLKRITRSEADRLWGYRDGTRETFIDRLGQIGLIRDETPLERFARETKTEITDGNRAAIEAALAWGRE